VIHWLGERWLSADKFPHPLCCASTRVPPSFLHNAVPLRRYCTLPKPSSKAHPPPRPHGRPEPCCTHCPATRHPASEVGTSQTNARQNERKSNGKIHFSFVCSSSGGRLTDAPDESQFRQLGISTVGEPQIERADKATWRRESLSRACEWSRDCFVSMKVIFLPYWSPACGLHEVIRTNGWELTRLKAAHRRLRCYVVDRTVQELSMLL